jgi:hypothetical protein
MYAVVSMQVGVACLLCVCVRARARVAHALVSETLHSKKHVFIFFLGGGGHSKYVKSLKGQLACYCCSFFHYTGSFAGTYHASFRLQGKPPSASHFLLQGDVET